MRRGHAAMWDLWEQGGPFIGDDGAPHSRITIEQDWWLSVASVGLGAYDKPPVRWWQRCDNSQIETEVPNLKSINIDRSIEEGSASCTIVLNNQWMDNNDEDAVADLGNPGYFTWNRGVSAESTARWGYESNAWTELLVPNALIRSYQGYGGRSKTVDEAIADGNIVLTGVWLVDRVTANSDGTLELSCRDMGKLLIEQQLYPPLIPPTQYPIEYRRWTWNNEQVQHTVQAEQSGGKRTVFTKSGNQAWYGPTGAVHGHKPTDSVDGNVESFWISVGNARPNAPYAVEYLEFDSGELVDAVYIHPWAGNYDCYISVMEGGNWVDGGGGAIPYEELGVGRYDGAYEARIPWVTRVGIPWETPQEYKLPRAYQADKVRVTFTNLQHSPWGPYPYRAGVRELELRGGPTYRTETTIEAVRHDGNYRDYSDIIKDLLLWSGWFCYQAVPSNEQPHVYGNIESTGVPNDDTSQDFIFDKSIFDKRPVIDAINQIKEIVGYIFWIDDEGGARFESPNWYKAGNFYEDGSFTSFIPEFDERKVLTEYTATYADDTARSEIIIASSAVTGSVPGSGALPGTVITRYTPPTAAILRGMVKPALWVNGTFTSANVQNVMAELIALHIWFQQRVGNVTCVANPLVGINDQVRIYERVTSETYIHYVRGYSTTHDLEAGTYTMTLTTNWLGDADDWAVKT